MIETTFVTLPFETSSKAIKTICPFTRRAYNTQVNFTMNDNQNYFVQAGRTTSRVKAQPGGKCSIMIGGWTPEELEKQQEKPTEPEPTKGTFC